MPDPILSQCQADLDKDGHPARAIVSGKGDGKKVTLVVVDDSTVSVLHDGKLYTPVSDTRISCSEGEVLWGMKPLTVAFSVWTWTDSG